MSTLRIIREVLNIAFGIGGLVFCAMYEMEPMLVAICLGLIAWSGYDLSKEFADRGSEDIARLDAEQSALEAKLDAGPATPED